MCYLSYQCEEIRKHRWIESEKAGRDLGKEAEMDWVVKYAGLVRKWANESELFSNKALPHKQPSRYNNN